MLCTVFPVNSSQGTCYLSSQWWIHPIQNPVSSSSNRRSCSGRANKADCSLSTIPGIQTLQTHLCLLPIYGHIVHECVHEVLELLILFAFKSCHDYTFQKLIACHVQKHFIMTVKLDLVNKFLIHLISRELSPLPIDNSQLFKAPLIRQLHHRPHFFTCPSWYLPSVHSVPLAMLSAVTSLSQDVGAPGFYTLAKPCSLYCSQLPSWQCSKIGCFFWLTLHIELMNETGNN